VPPRARAATPIAPTCSSSAWRPRRPDEASVSLVNAACAAAAEHDFERALEYAGRAGEQGAGAVRLATDALAARASVLTRRGRHEDALAAAAAALAEAERAGGPELAAMAEHDLGMACLAAGRHGEAAERLGRALDGTSRVPRAQARIARAEALARARHADAAESEVRAATLEPVGPGDLPLTLVPRMTRVQGLIAVARGASGRPPRAGARGSAPPAAPDSSSTSAARPWPVSSSPNRELARVEQEPAALAGDSVTPA
jgi:tetratricopeptide (TPR) repeat protein